MIPVRMLLFVMFTFWLGRGSNVNGSNVNGSNVNVSNVNGSNVNGSNVNGSNVNGSNDHDLVKYLYGETDSDDEIEIYDLPDDEVPYYLEKCY